MQYQGISNSVTGERTNGWDGAVRVANREAKHGRRMAVRGRYSSSLRAWVYGYCYADEPRMRGASRDMRLWMLGRAS